MCARNLSHIASRALLNPAFRNSARLSSVALSHFRASLGRYAFLQHAFLTVLPKPLRPPLLHLVSTGSIPLPFPKSRCEPVSSSVFHHHPVVYRLRARRIRACSGSVVRTNYTSRFRVCVFASLPVRKKNVSRSVSRLSR